MIKQRKHKSERIHFQSQNNQNRPSNRHKSEMLSYAISQLFPLTIYMKELLQELIYKSADVARQKKYVSNNIDAIINMADLIMMSAGQQSPDFLQKPKAIIEKEVQKEKKYEVQDKNIRKQTQRVENNSAISMINSENKYCLNSKEIMAKLKKQYQVNCRVGKENQQPIKLATEEDEEDDQLVHERTTLRGLKKYTQKNLKIIDIAKHQAMIEGKSSKDEDNFYDFDGKSLRLHKQNTSIIRTKNNKKNIIKAEITFNEDNVSSNSKPQLLKFRKKVSLTCHQQDSRNYSQTNNITLPPVQHLQTSIQNFTSIGKGVKIREATHKFLSRMSKLQNNTTHIRREKTTDYKLPNLNQTITSRINK